MNKTFTILLLLIVQHVSAQLSWTFIPPQTDASFRGLSVVDDSVAWVSGSKGWVGRSTNGGKDWSFKQVKNFEQLDFRTLYAFDTKTAVIANAGSPAVILYTNDSGNTWKEVYRNEDSAAFIDGIDFWSRKEGMIHGDPIEGRMLLLYTNDGGQSWAELPKYRRPLLAEGEASFAASGSCIRCISGKRIVIATGGKVSRLWWSNADVSGWQKISTPITQGEASKGIFSMAFRDERTIIIAGGDYKNDTAGTNNIFYTKNGGKDWEAPVLRTRGYRECITYLTANAVLAVGPSGMDISNNGGIKWEPLNDEKQFHVVKKSRKGKLVIAAGGGGKIGILTE